MSNQSIKDYLATIRKSNKFDTEFVDCLIRTNEDKYDGTYVGKKVLEIIEKRLKLNENKKDSS